MEPLLPTEQKKGVSPLVATVLLIAFAVALGAVVLNIVEPIFKNKVRCSQVQVELGKDLQGAPEVCFDSGFIKFKLYNNAESGAIDNLLVIITTADEQLIDADQLLKQPIEPGKPEFVSVPISEANISGIKTIDIIPKIKAGEGTEVKICSGQKIVQFNIPRCPN